MDQYSTLLQMTVNGRNAEEIAAATGWPVDAVTTLQQEFEHATAAPIPMEADHAR